MVRLFYLIEIATKNIPGFSTCAQLTSFGSLGKVRAHFLIQEIPHLAWVAELVDALASGASERKLVEVQVLSQAPSFSLYHSWFTVSYAHTCMEKSA